MKRKLLLLTLSVFAFSFLNAQVGQVNDFEDGTTQDWQIDLFGGGATNPPTNELNGMGGASDNYLSYTTNGNGGGAGSRMVILNVGSNWTGDFTADGIVEVNMFVRAIDNDLDVRVAFNGSGGEICTTNAVTVTPADGWVFVALPIAAGDFTLVDSGTDAAATLANVTEMRILSNSTPAWRGETFPGTPTTLDLDLITGSTTLNTTSFENTSDFSVYPNPGNRELNVKLQQMTSDSQVEVFDVLGKRVWNKELSEINTRINVSEWNAGVYLVRVTNGNASQTKRFVKQ